MAPSRALADLAPLDLPIRRDLRYDGDGFGLPLGSFAAQDQQLLCDLYTKLKGFCDQWWPLPAVPDIKALREHVESLSRSLDSQQALGAASRQEGLLTPASSKVLHDVRGGGLSLLMGSHQLLQIVPDPLPILTAFAFAARDHAKMMRNGILDIDAAGRDADREDRAHPVQDFVNKLQGTSLYAGLQAVRVQVDCTFEGAVAACCLETSAVDRILYNYLNNAARFAATSSVDLTIFPTSGKVTRWVVSNALTARQAGWLQDHTGMDLRKLFHGGTTHGGSGIGLSVCADFVASSFGLSRAREAIERSYLGACVVGDQFHAWFHWPAFQPPAGTASCPCGPAVSSNAS